MHYLVTDVYFFHKWLMQWSYLLKHSTIDAIEYNGNYTQYIGLFCLLDPQGRCRFLGCTCLCAYNRATHVCTIHGKNVSHGDALVEQGGFFEKKMLTDQGFI